jgi:predicted transcriptional regulator
MKVILLSIKPQYVDKILTGEKKFEYRKKIGKMSGSHLLIYSTNPVMKVVALVEIINTLVDTPYKLWDKTKKFSGISWVNYEKYFKGRHTAYAYELGKVHRFSSPKDLSDYDISFAPQSFRYVDFKDNLY